MSLTESTFNKLALACKNKDFKTVKNIFLTEKIDVNKSIIESTFCYDGPRKILHRAVYYNQGSLVRVLLKQNPDLQKTDSDGYGLGSRYITPFIMSLGPQVSKDILRKLLKHGANILQKAGRELELNIAFREAQTDKLKLILQHGATSPAYKDHADYFRLCLAILEGNLDIIRNSDINFPNFNNAIIPLFYAIHVNSTEIVKILLQKGSKLEMVVNGSTDKESALIYAMERNVKPEIVNDIVSTSDVDLHSFFLTRNILGIVNQTPLHTSILQDDISYMDMLLKRGAAANEIWLTGEMPLHFAAKLGKLNHVKLLVEFGADVNCRNSTTHATPLHVSTKHHEVVKFLLQKAANPNALNKNLESPLHESCKNGHFESLKLLIQYGGNTILRDKHGWTILHLAAYCQHTSTLAAMEFLLQRVDFNVDCKSLTDETPLLVANKTDCRRSLLLLKHGANCNAKTTSGKVVHFPKNCTKELLKHYPICQLTPYFKKLLLLGFQIDDSVAVSLAPRIFDLFGADVDEYLEEIRKMKGIGISWGPKRTLYDILFIDKIKMTTRFANNEKLVELYEKSDEDFEKSFPAYGFMLNLRYRRCLRRKFLMNSAVKVLETSICDYVPEVVTENILKYLTDYELKKISE